jgi:hypothetical protein
MKRRVYLKSSVATLAASTAGPVALGEIIAPNGEDISAAEMDRFLTEMDIAMDRISYTSGHYLNNLINQPLSDIDLLNFRAGMRSLLLIGSFGDLPVKGQVHPAMQKRLHYSAPEIDSTFMNLKNKLESMSPESCDEVKSILKGEPDLGDRIIESLDLEAQLIGVPSRRRRQMRRMGNRVIKRLRHSPELLINEYILKYEKLNYLYESDTDMDHVMQKHMGDQEFKDRHQKAEFAAFEWQKANLPHSPIGYTSLVNQNVHQEPSKEDKEPKKKRISTLGIGAIMTGAGWLLVGLGTLIGTDEGVGAVIAGVGVVFGVTIGPITMLIGLIMLIVQSSKKSKE